MIVPTTTEDLLATDAPNRVAGAEPLTGYKLLAPLGKGGFGEVWKCVAPGGLHKAIKFVPAEGDGFNQERSAFEHIKTIRHPFLLTLERVELIGNDLVMVMELADGQLADRFRECRAAGHPGIPRDELLGYMREAAEALDTLGAKYGLQHLDVKPENIFLVSGHAKVGDYGLVRRTELASGKGTAAGFTPKYTSPEVLQGRVDIRSDQYSLAVMYVELLTGKFPYPGRSAQQVMLQHIQGTPDLSGLLALDRPAVERAMSKDPAGRFPSCLAFVRELVTPDVPGRSSALIQPNRVPQPANPTYGYGYAITPPPLGADGLVRSNVPTESAASSFTARLVRPQDRHTAAAPKPQPAAPVDPFADLHPVMPVDRMHQPRPRAVAPPDVSALDFADAVVRAASQRHSVGVPAPSSGASEVTRFLSTMPVNMMPYKLVIVAERWGLSARHVDFTQVILRKEDRDPGGKTAKSVPPRGGYEVKVNLPAPGAAEVTVTTGLFGRPDDGFARMAVKDIPVIIGQVRSQLQNLEERRVHPRYPFETTVRVYPLYPDGLIGRGITGRVADVSLGGVRFVTPAEVETDRMFVEFPDVAAVRGQAIYMRVHRTHTEPNGSGVCTVGRFRRGQ